MHGRLNDNHYRKWIVLSTWYLGSQLKESKMNQGHTAWEVLKSVLSNRGLGTNVKKCLYEIVIASTASQWHTNLHMGTVRMKEGKETEEDKWKIMNMGSSNVDTQYTRYI